MIFQRAAGHVLHDDIALLLSDYRIKNLDDVRVVELADQRGLVEKKVGVELALFRILQHFRCGDLDRHIALGKRIAAKEHRAAGAFSDPFDQLILAEFLGHRLGY